MTLSEFASSRGVNYNTLNQYLWRHQDLRALLTRNETGALVVEPGTKAWEWLDKKYPDPSSVAVLTHHPDDLELISFRKLTKSKSVAVSIFRAGGVLHIQQRKGRYYESAKDYGGRGDSLFARRDSGLLRQAERIS